MTKAEAIVMLKRIQEPEAWEPQINQAAFDALDMAIKALEQQPCGDTISRQDAIDAAALSAAEWDGMYVQDINGRIREALEKLPSAQPERKKGKWIYDGDCYICNQCMSAFGWWADSQTSNYCPNCGADMRGEQDGH